MDWGWTVRGGSQQKQSIYGNAIVKSITWCADLKTQVKHCTHIVIHQMFVEHVLPRTVQRLLSL